MTDAAQFLAAFPRSQSTPADAIEKLYGVGFWLHAQERYADAALAFRTMVRTAPTDERGWLALGACHEKIEQPGIALELYGWAAMVVLDSVRCRLARARLLARLDRVSEAVETVDAALHIAEEKGDDHLVALVLAERETHVARH
jgi:tetratricopeptide (TPR) repeat protein